MIHLYATERPLYRTFINKLESYDIVIIIMDKEIVSGNRGMVMK